MATSAPVKNIPLDPSQWESPKEKFIGRLVRCEYSDTDNAKTKDGTTFTEHFNYPRALTTFEYAVERLDAVFVNEETEEKSPITRYGTLSLERYDERQHKVVPITQGDNKNTFVLGKWIEAKVKLHPDPEANVGMVGEWLLERTHKFGGNMAKNLLYPVRILAKPGVDFEYNGDVEEIRFKPKDDDATSLDDAAEEINAKSTGGSKSAGKDKAKAETMSDEEALKLFVGGDPENEDLATDIVTEHKKHLSASQKNDIITGSFLADALENDAIVIGEDGKYALPEAED